MEETQWFEEKGSDVEWENVDNCEMSSADWCDDEVSADLPQMAEDMCCDPVGHLHKALRTEWSFKRSPDMDPEIDALISHMMADPEGLVRDRAIALNWWESRAESLDEDKRALHSSLPPHLLPTLGKLHLPLLEEMLHASGHEDLSLMSDLKRGFPVIGEMSAGGVGTPRPGGIRKGGKEARGLVPDLEEFRRQCREINAQTLRRAKPSPHAQEIWRKTRREIEKGIIQNVRPIQEVDIDNILLVERFGVEQLDSERNLKIRPIDNYRSNGANDQTVFWVDFYTCPLKQPVVFSLHGWIPCLGIIVAGVESSAHIGR